MENVDLIELKDIVRQMHHLRSEADRLIDQPGTEDQEDWLRHQGNLLAADALDKALAMLGVDGVTPAERKRDLRRRFRVAPLPPVVRRPGARFYVTIRSGGSRRGALLGPYVSHMTALANVERARRLVTAAIAAGRVRAGDVLDAEFAEYGTASLHRTVRTVFGR